VNQNTFIFLDCIFNKVENSFGRSVFLIEDDLVLKVKPLKSEIYNASAFEIVLNLFASTVNNMRYLIGDDEFLILFT